MKRLPDPKPEKRIIDGTVEPLDSRPKDEGYCPVCGHTEAIFHKHHVVSRAQGGDDVPENLVWLCWHCHRRAHHPNDRRYTRTHILYLTYLRGQAETLAYVAEKKYPGYLDDRYLEERV